MFRQLDRHIWLWASLGPLLLILGLFALASAGLTWRLPVALLSISLSATITYFVQGEVRHLVAHADRRQQALSEELDELRGEYRSYRANQEREARIERVMLSELGALQDERNQLLADLYAVRREVVTERERRQKLVVEGREARDEAKQRMVALQADVTALRSQLNTLRVEHYQLSLEQENRTDVRDALEVVEEAKEMLTAKAREFQARQLELQTQLEETRAEAQTLARQVDAGSNGQLRQQFDARGRTLDATRIDLFQTQSELLALKHAQTEWRLQPDPALGELTSFSSALDAAYLEIGHLEELVSTLLSELTRRSVPGLELTQRMAALTS